VKTYDQTDKAKHYNQWEIQPLHIISGNKLDYTEGHALKYIMRYRFKGDAVKDLEKAREFIGERVSQLSGKSALARLIYWVAAKTVKRKVPLQNILYQKRGWDIENRPAHIIGLEKRIVTALAEQNVSLKLKLHALQNALTAIDLLLTEERRKVKT
jgi:hypothetical protein